MPLPFTASAYVGVPLADCSAKARGDVLSSLVRRMDEGWLHPGATFEVAVAGEAVNGRRRGQNMADYDWLRDEAAPLVTRRRPVRTPPRTRAQPRAR